MKSMQIDAVVNFPFPTPPDRIKLRKAQSVLTNLGALEASATTAADVGGTITDLGRAMSLFPLSPRYSKMLLLSRQQGCLPYMICVVAALSVGDPFLREENLGTSNAGPDGLDAEEMDSAGDDKEERRSQRRAFFASQQVRYSGLQCYVLLIRFSITPRLEKLRVIFFDFSQSSGRMNTREAG